MLHPRPCNSVGMRWGTDRTHIRTHAHRRAWPIYISPRLHLTRNVISHSCLYSPVAEHHRTLAGTHFPVPLRVGGWVGPGGLVKYWVCFPARRRSPIPVLTAVVGNQSRDHRAASPTQSPGYTETPTYPSAESSGAKSPSASSFIHQLTLAGRGVAHPLRKISDTRASAHVSVGDGPISKDNSVFKNS